MLEKDIERKLCEGVKRLGGYAYKFTSPSNVGVPDRLVIMPGGKISFAELKTDTGRLSVMQEYQIKKLRALGCNVKVVKGMAGVNKYLEELKNDI